MQPKTLPSKAPAPGSSSTNTASVAAAAPTPAPASSTSYLSGLGSWAASKIVTSSKADAVNQGSAEIQISSKNVGEISSSTSKSQPIEAKKPTPAFSSLSLRDAGVGGASTGWSDDEFDDTLPQTTNNTNGSLIPSFATDGDDNFMAQFDSKNAIRPRTGGLKTPARIAANARRREELSKRKVEKKPSVMKLKIDKDPILDNGWDDF
jgi:hypothetical protein